MEATDAMNMIASQMPAELKRARADYVIENNGSLQELERDVNALWSSLQRDAERTNPLAGQTANSYVETQSEARVS
jgi:dephospho-CoA kinase